MPIASVTLSGNSRFLAQKSALRNDKKIRPLFKSQTSNRLDSSRATTQRRNYFEELLADIDPAKLLAKASVTV